MRKQLVSIAVGAALGASGALAQGSGSWLGGGAQGSESGSIVDTGRPPPPPVPGATLDRRILDPVRHRAQARKQLLRYLDGAGVLARLQKLDPVVAQVRVGAQDPGHRTGIRVPRGAVVRVVPLDGSWTVDHRNYPGVGPEGHLDLSDLYTRWGHLRAVQTLPFARLLGSVAPGEYFDAGLGHPIELKRGGELLFKINDQVGAYGDNQGELIFDVEIYTP